MSQTTPSADLIYLDHNATAPIDPRVAAVVADASRRYGANPASQHGPGRAAKKALENARDEIAALLGARFDTQPSDQVVFTSGGTEANNLALRGLAGSPPGEVVVSAIEHPSIAGLAIQMSHEGYLRRRLGVDRRGLIEVDELESLFCGETRLVCVMLGNNETGVLEPVAEVAALCREARVPLHTDAVQVAGKLPIDFHALGVSTMSVSAHKFHGPQGVGALIVCGGTRLEPLLHGGFQQLGLRPGTEPVALAVGMAAALRFWHDEAAERSRRMAALRDRLEMLIRDGWPDVVVHSGDAPRLPHTSHLGFPGLDRQALLMALDLRGVACSAGSACASGSSEPSPTLLAMGVSEPLAAGSIRLSLGGFTTAAEIDEAARRILWVCNDLRGKKLARNSTASPPTIAGKPV